MSVKHKFISAIADGADVTQVRPSNWNDEHEVAGVVLKINGVEPDSNGSVTLSGNIDGGEFT